MARRMIGAALALAMCFGAGPGALAQEIVLASHRAAYVLGLGAEYRYTRNVSSFVEYRYYNYSKATFTRLNGIVDSSNSEIRVGVLYRF